MSFRPLLGHGRIRSREEKSETLQTAAWVDSSVVFDNRRWVCRDAELRWTAPHHLVVLTEEGGTSHTSIRSGEKSVYDGMDRPGDLTFVPAGAERLGTYRDVNLSYSALWIDPEFPGSESLADTPILVNRSDNVIATLLSSLRVEMALGHKPDTGYVEHLAALVSLRVAMLAGKQLPAPRYGRLSRRTFARIREYIEARINSDISLRELAAVAEMGVDTFARRFKATTGLAPYAYVIEERVRQAEVVLRETGVSIGTIAFRFGFSSQSHFTATFRRLRGMTPRAYRVQFSPES
ncbi:AraC family transcriptional regulator [Mesorhizobium sp. M0496]|uniref:AraC family transcriptional regulator n=1 Tax=Mesorhizobium sp. M0496 TaxID=2956952 RepID=UPI0033393680